MRRRRPGPVDAGGGGAGWGVRTGRRDAHDDRLRRRPRRRRELVVPRRRRAVGRPACAGASARSPSAPPCSARSPLVAAVPLRIARARRRARRAARQRPARRVAEGADRDLDAGHRGGAARARRDGRPRRASAVAARRRSAPAAGLVALAGFALEGHTRSQHPLALMAALDVVHLAAGAVWLGGIAALVVAFRARTAPDVARARRRAVQRDRGRRRRGRRRRRDRDGDHRPARRPATCADGLRPGPADQGGARRPRRRSWAATTAGASCRRCRSGRRGPDGQRRRLGHDRGRRAGPAAGRRRCHVGARHPLAGRRRRRRRRRRRPRPADAVELPLSGRRRHGAVHGRPGARRSERDRRSSCVDPSGEPLVPVDAPTVELTEPTLGVGPLRPVVHPAGRRRVPRHRRHPARRHLQDGRPRAGQRLRGRHRRDDGDDRLSRSGDVASSVSSTARSGGRGPARGRRRGRDGEQPDEHHAGELGQVLGLADERDTAVDEVDDGGDHQGAGEHGGDRQHRAGPRRPDGDDEQPDAVGRGERAEVAGGVGARVVLVAEHQRAAARRR